jgi:hypothetical protein
MRKLSLNLITCTVFFALLFTSCEKETTVKTKTELISQSTWKFDHATSSGFDVSSLINACIKDNIITFSSNGSGTTDEGPTKCNAGDPQTQNFTWNFITNETVLNVNAAIFAGQSGNFTILALTETSLALEGTISTSSGNVTGQIYFIH